jgi:peptidoglycan/xylan/chitin deacetylase (PgdA/CDA1 family)
MECRALFTMVRAIHGAGHPIGVHGYLHDSLDTLEEAAEDSILQPSRTILADLTGEVPTLYVVGPQPMDAGTLGAKRHPVRCQPNG